MGGVLPKERKLLRMELCYQPSKNFGIREHEEVGEFMYDCRIKANEVVVQKACEERGSRVVVAEHRGIYKKGAVVFFPVGLKLSHGRRQEELQTVL
jgi:hypothetical protein